MNEQTGRQEASAEETVAEHAAHQASESARPTQPIRRRLAAVWGLLFLAPWVGEYLLGNLSVRVLPALPFLAPLYGGGALLVREFARRTGRGWPTILVLGAAYGVVEAGLVDQSLFNPAFSGLEYLDAPPTPLFGFSVYYAIAFVVGHAVWSISVPVAIVELLTPAARTTPWLGRTGLGVAGLVYVGGCLLIFADVRATEDYLASPAQFAGAAAVAVVLVVVAFAVPSPGVLRDVTPGGWGTAPGPKALAVISFVFASALFAKPENWAGVILAVVLVCLGAVFVHYWSRQPGWGVMHQFAVVVGLLLTYAWGGFVLTSLVEPDDGLRWAGNAAFALVAVVLLVVTGKRLAVEEQQAA